MITATDVDRMCPYNYLGGPGPEYSQTFRIGVLFKAQTLKMKISVTTISRLNLTQGEVQF